MSPETSGALRAMAQIVCFTIPMFLSVLIAIALLLAGIRRDLHELQARPVPSPSAQGGGR